MNKLKKLLEKGKNLVKIGVVAGSLLIAGEVTAQAQDNLSSNLNASYSTYNLSPEEIKTAQKYGLTPIEAEVVFNELGATPKDFEEASQEDIEELKKSVRELIMTKHELKQKKEKKQQLEERGEEKKEKKQQLADRVEKKYKTISENWKEIEKKKAQIEELRKQKGN